MPDQNSCDEVALREIRKVVPNLDKESMTALRRIIIKHRKAVDDERAGKIIQIPSRPSL